MTCEACWDTLPPPSQTEWQTRGKTLPCCKLRTHPPTDLPPGYGPALVHVGIHIPVPALGLETPPRQTPNSPWVWAWRTPLPRPLNLPPGYGRVATAQGKQGIWFLLFPDRENTGNFALAQGKILKHRENVFLWHRENFRHRENIWLWLLK